MAERIDLIQYVEPTLPSTQEPWETMFLTGPAEFLCQTIVKEINKEPVWPAFFGKNIDPYKRMDYPIRTLPAMRIYIDAYRKANETWYVDGIVNLDVIFPVNVLRANLEQIPSTISSALLQQFRRTTFFGNVLRAVPGLNELGKTFDVDKSLAFAWQEGTEQETLCPMIQILLNFRLLLEEWDRYATEDNRESDSPFLRTIGDFTKLRTVIQGVDDDGNEIFPEV